MSDFFSWDLKNIPDLTEMHDLKKASARLIEAMQSGELIGIYGDYDVDGTTSCALLYHFFQMFGIEVDLVAMGANPIPLILPCHRVLAAAGRAGGFSAPGGVATKMKMLAMEQAAAPGGQYAFGF